MSRSTLPAGLVLVLGMFWRFWRVLRIIDGVMSPCEEPMKLKICLALSAEDMP